MKKEVIVTTPARKAIPSKKKTVLKVLCDFCSKPTADHYGNQRSCSICSRDLCPKHTKWDPDDPSDYPDKFCSICLRIYIPARSEMRERHWKEEDELDAEFKTLSLKEKV